MKKMLSAMVAACFLLTGCSATTPLFTDAEDLLRAPQQSETQSAVLAALNEYTGETVKLKYPRGGELLLPIQMQDMDGDGKQEAAVLYTLLPDGQNVNFAVLEEEEDGWVVAATVQGLSTEVAQIAAGEVTGTGVQMAVCYANTALSSRYLTVYNYCDGELTSLLESACSRFAFVQLSAQGGDAVVLQPAAVSETTGIMLQLYVLADAPRMELRQSVALDSRLRECVRICTTQSRGEYGIVVDGLLASGNLASQLFRANEEGRFNEVEFSENPVLTTMRYQEALSSRDIDRDGAVEIPVLLTNAGSVTANRRFYLVAWQNYLLANPDVQFGVYDAAYGYFMRLPNSWKGKVSVTNTADDAVWQVRRLDETESLRMNVRIVPAAEAAPGTNATLAAQTGDYKVYVSFVGSVSSTDRNVVTNGVQFIN